MWINSAENRYGENFMINKNEIPILEFDDSITAVIEPNNEYKDLILPKKCIFAFLGEYIDEFACKMKSKVVEYFVSATKKYPVYVFNYENQEICLVQAPVGSSASTQILDWLIGHGVTEIISTGSCGVLIDLAENEFVIPVKALRDEGTSFHYLRPSRFVEMDKRAISVIKEVMELNSVRTVEGMTWSTDGFFRETRDKVLYRKDEGCIVVEMECSALMACAKMRSVLFGQILFTADSLNNIYSHDIRSWGVNSYDFALKLCLDIVLKMNN